jgi:hypothetical protein
VPADPATYRCDRMVSDVEAVALFPAGELAVFPGR